MRFRLVPSDDTFFALFCDAATNVADCARRLRDLLDGVDDEARFEAVVACEKRGDELTRQILSRLNSTFVTPFDREDIHELAEELDDVVDDMLEVAQLLRMIGVREALPEMKEQADLLLQAGAETVELVARLRTMKGVRPHLDAVDRIESEGDGTYRRTISRLFSGEFDALDVLRWRDVVEAMEAALDRMEDISDTVEAIVVKHA